METMNTSESWWDSLVDFATNNAVAFWVIVAAVVLALIVIIALIVGTKRKKSKTVRFGGEDAEEPKQLTQQQKSGNYQATGGFNFASGGAGEKQPVVKPEPQEPTTESSEPLAEEKPEAQKPVETPDETPADEPVLESAEPAEPTELEEAEPEETKPEPEAQDKKTKPDTTEPVAAPAEDAEETEPETSSEAKQEVEPDPEAEPVAGHKTEPEDSEPAPEPAVEPAVKEDAAPKEDIAPAAGRLSKLRGRLSKSQNAIGQGVLGLLTAGDLDEDAWEEIEDTLIMADLGTNATMKVTDLLRDKIAERGVSSEAEARAMLREALIEVGKPEMDRSIKAMPHDGKPAVAMIVGVNGTGKTTTTGKLGRVLVAMGHDVVFGAADTFRAAAADQLETWGRRVGATTVRGA